MSWLAASVSYDATQPPSITSDPAALDAGQLAVLNAIVAEIEHQADHWDTADHGSLGHIIAEALRAAVDITMAGGLQCQHRAARE